MEWVKIIVSLVGVVSILKLLAWSWGWVWDKIIIHNFPSRLIQVYPINEQGSNVVRRTRESSTLEEFLIKINFDLVTRFSVTITQIKIFPNLRATPKFLSIKINGNILDEESPYKIKKGEAVKVRISKGITCNWGDIDALYYLKGSSNERFSDDVQIVLNLSSGKWHGIKKIEVVGTLFPGGKLKNLHYHYLK